ncbi:hypothetical protein PBT90_09090 [Algoriphagus halophytocola]|uniref:Uncharacterized protein n=1 Tax=Algoriphagus halophytocola TaxID=2991499 RepID=A0ABY6MMB7_9BACT|nr:MULTISPECIES: hypothetical protein [unclassified Algoriphagus]UZD23542.1 hypothetical protein OM944_03415 [Algoriphagus sp. TR-M5]WBL44836.1 hypothetical protein PBT90_09090 [Algoriphagus sp. TR-M9]|tara:strand:+ start:1872 stop:2033 length:162 start_codon:yes stop_codon:yes gene_type:complete
MKKSRKITKMISQGYKEALAMQAGKIKYKTNSSFSEMETDLEPEKSDDLKDYR